MNATSVLGWLWDRTVGGIIRMLRESRIPDSERGPLSWNFYGTLGIIMVYGLVVLFSASYTSGYYNYSGDVYHFIRPQAKIAFGGFLLILLLSRLNYRALRHMTEALYYVTLAFLVAVLLLPTDVEGFHRWIRILGISFQPSEVAKFWVILWIADYADKHYQQRHTLRHGIVGPIAPVIPILILLLMEPHNSATLLIVLIAGTMLVCGGCGLKWIPPVGIVGAAALWIYLSQDEGHGSERLGGVWGLTLSDTSEMGWQTKQGLYAISSGGIKGLGIGNSRQKHQWLPYAENDFIFSILCEELGFLGAVLCIILFGVLIVQGILIALRAPDFYGSMLGIGIVAQVAWQVFCHIGVNTALLPNTGISLPFFSSGGTSLLMLLCEMGVLLSISRAGNARMEAQKKRQQAEFEQKLAGRRVVHRRESN